MDYDNTIRIALFKQREKEDTTEIKNNQAIIILILVFFLKICILR